MTSWREAGFELAVLPQITPEQLRQRLSVKEVHVLDVRREPEWTSGHIPEAQLWPLDKFAAQLPDLDKSTPVVVHCKGGYRSIIACSLLRKAGYAAVTNLIGGYDAWEQTTPPKLHY